MRGIRLPRVLVRVLQEKGRGLCDCYTCVCVCVCSQVCPTRESEITPCKG